MIIGSEQLNLDLPNNFKRTGKEDECLQILSFKTHRSVFRKK